MPHRTGLYLIVLAAVTFAVLSPVLKGQFVNWDDDEYILENPLIREITPASVGKMFTENLTGKYHPLTLLSFAVEYHFFKLQPFYYHATNLFFHVLNTMLVYVVLSTLLANPGIALIAAFLFGVHPLQVEPVAWVSSRKDVLFMFFYLLGLYCYLGGRAQHKEHGKYRVLTYVFFICSLLSKAMAVSFPLILILIDYFKEDRLTPKKILDKWPFFAICLGLGLFTMSNAGQTEAFPNTAIYGFGERVLYSMLAFLLYIIKVVFPYPLSAFYALKMSWLLLILSALIVVAGSVLVFLTFRRHGLVKFCFLFYILTIWPVLHFFQMNDSLIYERFMYLPSIGLFILIGHAVDEAIKLRRRWIGLVVMAVFIVWASALIPLSSRQTKIWQNSGTLWANVIRHFPLAYPAYNNMGVYLEQQHRFEEAALYFMKMIEVEPRYAEGYFKLANMIAIKFDTSGAIRYYSKAIEHNPKHYKAFNNRGNQYLVSGMYDLALKDYTAAIALKGDYENAFLNRGMCYFATNRFHEAAQDFTRALQLNPLDDGAREKIIYMKKANLL